jgi:SRSO17 transposase
MAASLGISGWRAELEALLARFGRLFVRAEPREQAGRYLEGLLGRVRRKNGWQLAEHLGDARPWRTQRVLSQVLRDEAAARDLCRDYAVERLGAEDAVLVVDETGFVKKGRHSAGVARQYSGTAGRVENSQVGVFLAYGSRRGHALIDRRLYLPEAWAGDMERRRAAKVPEDVPFLTKPAIAREMVARALDAGVPCEWVLADAVYGADRRLRMMLEERGRPYLLAIRGNDKLWSEFDGTVGQHAPEALARALPPQAWRRLSAGAGAKGERLYDWARVRLVRLQPPPWEHWLLVRRSIADPKDLAYFVAFGPAEARLLDLARVAGRRWLVEECFEAAKQAGRQRRPGLGGLRGPELARLASPRHARHAGAGPPRRPAGRTERGKKGRRATGQLLVPPSVPEIRRLIARLASGRAPPAPAFVLDWSFWRRAHQAAAQAFHWGRRLTRVQPQL